jgi:hypothetical protein
MKTVPIEKQLLIDLVALWKLDGCNKGSPNHGHEIPGIWDSDNGVLAGKPCAECALYDEARRIVAMPNVKVRG